MDEKGQVSLEAVLVLGVGILVIVSVFNLGWTRLSLAREVGEAGEARMIGELLAEGINNAYTNGGNFTIMLTDGEINFTRLDDKMTIEGGGMNLPILIDRSQRTINISKDMSKTGGDAWNTTVAILPVNITSASPTVQYPETTIRNNGSYVIIYAKSTHIQVVP